MNLLDGLSHYLDSSQRIPYFMSDCRGNLGHGREPVHLFHFFADIAPFGNISQGDDGTGFLALRVIPVDCGISEDQVISAGGGQGYLIF